MEYIIKKSVHLMLQFLFLYLKIIKLLFFFVKWYNLFVEVYLYNKI